MRVATFALALFAVAALARAGELPPSEYEVKAVFLYNFAKFVEWPAEAFRGAGAPFVICVVGDDPFGELLENTTRGERVNGHEIAIRRFNSEDGLRGCHIVFVSTSERKRLTRVFDAVKGSATLTVGETEDFARQGGVIDFVKERYRIGFEINVAAAERAQLKISSKLLSLARIVGSSRP